MHHIKSLTRGRSSSTASAPLIIGGAMLGLSMAGSSSALWWGIGSTLISVSAVLAVGSLVVDHLRGLRRSPWGRGTWTAAAVAIPLAAVVGALVFDGPPSALAVTPVLTVACAVGAERSGARRGVVTAVACTAGAVALFVLLRECDASVGFATLVQGSVVSGLFVALLIAVRAATRKRRC